MKLKKDKKPKFYNLENILAKNCVYNIIFGERSNGKSYALKKYAIDNYLERKEQTALIRRWDEDFKGKRGVVLFDDICEYIAKKTKNEWTDVKYYAGRWYLMRREEENVIVDDTPFLYGFSLTAMEHDKSTNYPNITTIVFDEFLSRNGYLNDEFVMFMNTCSTIIRHRENVKIFMLGNAVSRYSPYFEEMGLTHVGEQALGTIDIYTYGNSKLSVAVERTAPTEGGKASDFYFAFDNPRLRMIQNGGFELGLYAHLSHDDKYRPADVACNFFIEFKGDIIKCDVVVKDDRYFIFCQRKTTELKAPDTDLIFSPLNDSRPNWRKRLTKPVTRLEHKIYDLFVQDKVYYATNEVGEVVRNYLLFCKGVQ